MGFSRQGYWSGVPFPPPGDLPNPGIKPSFIKSPALAGEFFTTCDTWEAHRSLGSWENSERLCLNDVWSIVGMKKPETVQMAGRWIDKLWPSLGFPGVSDGKESVCNIGGLGSIPELGWSPGGGSGNPLLAWRIPRREEPGGLQSMGSLSWTQPSGWSRGRQGEGESREQQLSADGEAQKGGHPERCARFLSGDWGSISREEWEGERLAPAALSPTPSGGFHLVGRREKPGGRRTRSGIPRRAVSRGRRWSKGPGSHAGPAGAVGAAAV